MRLAQVTTICGALLMVALGAGCKQTDGERCQIDTDCEEGLICCVLPNKTTKGTCREKTRCTATDSGVPDAEVKKDGKADDQKVTTPDNKVTTPDQKVTTPDQKVTTPDQKVTTPDQKVTTPDQKVTTPDQKVGLDA